MTQLTPAAVKPHLAIAAGDTGDDTLLQDYIAAAEAWICQHVRRDLDVEYSEGWPTPILQAVRLLVAHWYQHREAVTGNTITNVIPFGVAQMLAPYRDLSA